MATRSINGIAIAAALALLVSFGGVTTAQAPVQTAELVKRGLGPDDFPRITRLADDVYAYEDVHVQAKSRPTA